MKFEVSSSWMYAQTLSERFPEWTVENISFKDRPDLQRLGIDWVLTSGSHGLTLDAKTNHKDWGEAALETVQDVETGKPGWALNHLHQSDFIAWAVPGKLRLIPAHLMRRVVQKHSSSWREVRALNRWPSGKVVTHAMRTVGWGELWQLMRAEAETDDERWLLDETELPLPFPLEAEREMTPAEARSYAAQRFGQLRRRDS